MRLTCNATSIFRVMKSERWLILSYDLLRYYLLFWKHFCNIQMLSLKMNRASLWPELLSLAVLIEMEGFWVRDRRLCLAKVVQYFIVSLWKLLVLGKEGKEVNQGTLGFSFLWVVFRNIANHQKPCGQKHPPQFEMSLCIQRIYMFRNDGLLKYSRPHLSLYAQSCYIVV